MNVITMNSFLLDGPLMTTCERRKQVAERMAFDLIQSTADLTCIRDVRRVLRAEGYHYFDVAILAPVAQMLAFQDSVAAEMSAS